MRALRVVWSPLWLPGFALALAIMLFALEVPSRERITNAALGAVGVLLTWMRRGGHSSCMESPKWHISLQTMSAMRSDGRSRYRKCASASISTPSLRGRAPERPNRTGTFRRVGFPRFRPNRPNRPNRPINTIRQDDAMPSLPDHFLQLRSTVTSSGQLRVMLAEVPMPVPGPDEVIIRIEASPINPSDMGLLFGLADLSNARMEGSAAQQALVADISAAAMRAMQARLDQPLPVGNEAAGTVVGAGSSAPAQALLGKTVAMLGGEMYAEYRCLSASQCMVLPAGVDARKGASCYVNPLTALSMPETMRSEGHTAIVHTAAASNLGQMLNRICIADGIALVNIVRKPEQETLLREAGARYVLDSSSEGFMPRLIDALAETGATIGFDAIGGGPLAGQILLAMEAAASRGAGFSRYGSSTHKQVYVYGRLDLTPTVVPPGVGMAWGMGGYLLTYFLQKIGADGRRRLRERVVSGLDTLFASHYTREITLAQMLDIDTARACNAKSTGEKYLLVPAHAV